MKRLTLEASASRAKPGSVARMQMVALSGACYTVFFSFMIGQGQERPQASTVITSAGSDMALDAG